MNAAASARKVRVTEMVIAFGLALLGAFLMWFSLAGLVPFVRGAGARAPLVTFSTMDARALPAALAAFSLAVMLCAPGSWKPIGTGPHKSEPDRRMMRWVGVWLTLGVIFAFAALLAGPIAQIVAEEVMEGDGYHLCSAPQKWEHHPPFRWVRGGGRCP